MNIIIVGCGNVGFETAKLLSKEHRLLLIDLYRPQYLDDFIKDEKDITFSQADATDTAQVEKAISAFTDRYHQIDALVSTIGAMAHNSPVDNFSLFKKNFELNFFGNLVPIKCAINHMIAARSGRLIIMSSTSGHHSPKSLAAYAPAKWALESLSSTLRSELRPFGITVDVLSPATIKNRYSQTFITKDGGNEPSEIASIIKSILQRSNNSNHFIPARVRFTHLIERMGPYYFDRSSGLKPRAERERSLRNVSVDTVLITGASSDLGKKLASLNAKTARALYLVDEDREPLLEIKSHLEAASGCEVRVAAPDWSDTQSIKEYADGIEGVDVFINVPRPSSTGSVNDTPLEHYKMDLDTYFFGTLYLLSELLKKEHKPKKFINVLSSMAIAGRQYYSSYACTMAALWSITRSLRRIYGNELQVMEVISSLGTPGEYALKADKLNPGIFNGGSPADAAARKIYGAAERGKEIVVIPARVRFLIVIEALTPRVYNKVFT